MRTSLEIDDRTQEAIWQMKKPFKASALFRWLMKALTSDNKEWDKLIKTDPEIKAVQDFIRPRLRHVLGFDETETKKRS
jgi:adenine C2-methylase RlmN of 23S rRNA A2503 and tRNA A37